MDPIRSMTMRATVHRGKIGSDATLVQSHRHPASATALPGVLACTVANLKVDEYHFQLCAQLSDSLSLLPARCDI